MIRKLFLLSVLSGALFAQGDEEPSQSLWDYHPIHLGGNILRIGKADVDGYPDGHLYFRKNNAYLMMLVPISAETYFFPRVDWNSFTLDWNKNPKFNQTHFYYAQFGLMCYTTAMEHWRWIARVDGNLDLEHFAHPGTYGLLSGFLWGAYQFSEKWHYHIGGLGYVGLKGDTVYPLIGFDYSWDDHWKITAIFPIEYSLQYKLGKEWRFSLKGRPLKERFRTGGQQPQPRSIFSYSTIGAEANIHYEREMRFELELFAGYNFGGNFYIKNQNGHEALYTTVGGAPYAGGTIDYAF
jgi:hypothetical protein